MTRETLFDRRLRIGFFLPHFSAGGIERVVLNLLLRLDPEVFEITLILGRREGNLLAQVPDGIEIVDLEGVKMRWIVPKLRRRLQRLHLDVIYSGTNAANLALLLAGATMSLRPAIIISEHTLGSLYLKEAKWTWLRTMAMRILYPRADLVVTPLADLGIELRHILNIPELPVQELLNPLFDTAVIDRQMPTTGAQIAVRAYPYFVAAGRLSRVKGYDLLLHAFAWLSRERTEPHLIMLGDGEERTALEQLALDLGVRDKVHFEGYVDQPMEFFQDAIALVISSQREGTPNVIPEAMAAGTAVIAKNCSIGVRRLLAEGHCGLLLDSPGPEDLAIAMRTLVDDATHRSGFVAAGRHLARCFSFQETIPRYARTFIDVATGRVFRGAPIKSVLDIDPDSLQAQANGRKDSEKRIDRMTRVQATP